MKPSSIYYGMFWRGRLPSGVPRSTDTHQQHTRGIFRTTHGGREKKQGISSSSSVSRMYHMYTCLFLLSHHLLLPRVWRSSLVHGRGGRRVHHRLPATRCREMRSTTPARLLLALTPSPSRRRVNRRRRLRRRPTPALTNQTLASAPCWYHLLPHHHGTWA